MTNEEVKEKCKDVFKKQDYSCLDYICRKIMEEYGYYSISSHFNYLCEKVLEEDKNNIIALNYKAFSHKSFPRLAFPILDRVLELDSNNYFAYNTMALSYMIKEDYEKALKCAQKGLQIKDYDWLRINKIEALICLNRVKEAHEFYKEREIPNYSFVKGLIDCGKYSILKEEYEESLSKEELLDYYYKRLKYLDNKGWRDEEILDVCERIIEIDKDNEIALEFKITALESLERNEEAIKWSDYAIELYPNNICFYFYKAETLFWSFNDLDGAIEYYEKGFAHVNCIGYYWPYVNDIVDALYKKAEQISWKEAISIYDRILFYKKDEFKALNMIDSLIKEHGIEYEYSENYRESSILKMERDNRLKEIDDFLEAIEIGDYDKEYLKGCSEFKDYDSFADYVRDVIICLIESPYGYTEERARERVKISMNSIKGDYEVEEPAAYCVIEVGYSCG